MALTIKGLNTGVIRHNDKFIALALKVKSLRNKETLLFFPVLALRDLLIGLEHPALSTTLASGTRAGKTPES
ncbi:inner membrane protein [Salmonella enterica subsp. enterica]|uniref:Inner membrane protein n=1 Tax=Salmonella enterica I TaxID=59201 RepID=A0A379VY96_SALET|nr:inner membrane protein [Salmonella enterica subsp. enterica]